MTKEATTREQISDCDKYREALVLFFSPIALEIKDVEPAKIPTPNAMIINEIGNALESATSALGDICPA